MPRYFFNVRSADAFLADEEGGDFPNVEAAKREANLSAREILADALENELEVDGRVFEVTDESGAVVFKQPLRDALKLD